MSQSTNQTNQIMYSGFVAIVGRPNVGKSTLLNQMLGQKISITSKKAQTTRHRILGVDTEENYQTVYVDTPGIHSDEKKALNKVLNQTARASMADVDLIIFVVEANQWHADDELVLRRIQQAKKPCLLLINKTDLVPQKEQLLPYIEQLVQKHDFLEVYPLSARSPEHVPHLKAVVRQYLKPGIHYFDADDITDKSLRFMVAEIVREKLIRFMGQELPYALTVEIEKYEAQPSGVTLIHAAIIVERESQKGMVIGQRGQKLKQIGQEARRDIEKLVGHQVNLQLWVKVRSGWSDDDRALRSLGYGD